jgi:hypothetical protein
MGFRRSGFKNSERTVWLQSELMRHSARDIAEAGRELGRFDSRPWLGSVRPPVAVLITTRDELVSPFRQQQLAQAAGGPVFEVGLTHMELVLRAREYNPRLLEAIASVSAETPATHGAPDSGVAVYPPEIADTAR